MAKFTVQIPTYRTNLEVYIYDSDEKLDKRDAKIAKAFGVESDGFGVRGRSYDIYGKDGFRTATMVFDSRWLDIGVMVHEALHAVFYILRYVDIQPEEVSEEAYTCLHEYIVNSCYREMVEREIDLSVK